MSSLYQFLCKGHADIADAFDLPTSLALAGSAVSRKSSTESEQIGSLDIFAMREQDVSAGRKACQEHRLRPSMHAVAQLADVDSSSLIASIVLVTITNALSVKAGFTIALVYVIYECDVFSNVQTLCSSGEAISSDCFVQVGFVILSSCNRRLITMQNDYYSFHVSSCPLFSFGK